VCVKIYIWSHRSQDKWDERNIHTFALSQCKYVSVLITKLKARSPYYSKIVSHVATAASLTSCHAILLALCIHKHTHFTPVHTYWDACVRVGIQETTTKVISYSYSILSRNLYNVTYGMETARKYHTVYWVSR